MVKSAAFVLQSTNEITQFVLINLLIGFIIILLAQSSHFVLLSFRFSCVFKENDTVISFFGFL